MLYTYTNWYFDSTRKGRVDIIDSRHNNKKKFRVLYYEYVNQYRTRYCLEQLFFRQLPSFCKPEDEWKKMCLSSICWYHIQQYHNENYHRSPHPHSALERCEYCIFTISEYFPHYLLRVNLIETIKWRKMTIFHQDAVCPILLYSTSTLIEYQV